VLSGNPLLDAALLAGLAGALRAWMSARGKSAKTDPLLLVKNIILAGGIGFVVAWSGIPAAELVGMAAAVGAVDVGERAVKAANAPRGPESPLDRALGKMRAAVLAEKKAHQGPPEAIYGLSLGQGVVLLWAETTDPGLSAALSALAAVEPDPLLSVAVKDLEEEE